MKQIPLGAVLSWAITGVLFGFLIWVFIFILPLLNTQLRSFGSPQPLTVAWSSQVDEIEGGFWLSTGLSAIGVIFAGCLVWLSEATKA